MWNSGLDEEQAGIKIAGRNINNLRFAGDTTLMAKSKEELKNLSIKVKEESEKAGLKLSVQKTKIMASSAITSWQIDGETMETVTDFIFLGSKISVVGDCSYGTERCLLLGRKAMTNLASVLKIRDITLLTKLWQSYGFPVVMYGCESWTIKKAEYWRMDAFKLWCWKRFLRVRMDCKEIKPVNPKENQLWIFIERTVAEAPILGLPDVKRQLIGKDPGVRTEWRQKEKELIEDKMVR